MFQKILSKKKPETYTQSKKSTRRTGKKTKKIFQFSNNFSFVSSENNFFPFHCQCCRSFVIVAYFTVILSVNIKYLFLLVNVGNLIQLKCDQRKKKIFLCFAFFSVSDFP